MMNTKLNRTLTLWPLTLYGVGTILGAGIYVIISEVAVEAGALFPLSFLVAASVAAICSLSYAEMSSRYPQSAGEAVYVKNAFGWPLLTVFIGYAVAFTGIMSAAAILRGFHGYLSLFLETPQWLCTTVLAFTLMAVAIKGVKESVAVVATITMIEVTGLLLVIFFGLPQVIDHPEALTNPLANLDTTIFAGAFVAFFAFIGFEDMVNMAEETKDAETVLPRAILLALVISTLLYFAVAISTQASLSLDAITASKAPLALVIERYSSLPPEVMGLIGMVAIINGGLVQVIMVSRLIYGMAKLNRAPKVFSKVSERTRTPIISTVTFSTVIWVLSLSLEIGNLAKLASFIILVVFFSVNASLIVIRLKPGVERAGFQVPLAFPIMGATTCVLLLGLVVLF